MSEHSIRGALAKFLDGARVLWSTVKKSVILSFASAIAIVGLVALLAAPKYRGLGTIIAYLVFLVILVVFGILMYQRELAARKNEARSAPQPVLREDGVTLANGLTEIQRDTVLAALRSAIADAADILDHHVPDDIRANIFGWDGAGMLRMIPNLTVNMRHAPEMTMEIPVGYGGAGRCFHSRDPNIAVFKKDWGKNAIPDEQMAKVNPRLRWIVSVPVPYPPPSDPKWVMNVDGLFQPPRSPGALENVIARVLSYTPAMLPTS